MDCDFDHWPIAKIIDWAYMPEITEPQRLWTQINVGRLREMVKTQPQKQIMTKLASGKNTAMLVRNSVEALDTSISASTPRSDPSSCSRDGLGQECEDICVEVQQLRRI